MATRNDGMFTRQVVSSASIGAYLLVDLSSSNTVRPYVQSSGRICFGSTVQDSTNGYALIMGTNVNGSRLLKLDYSQTVACTGPITHGATAGTIKPATGSDVVIGHCIDAGATSAADAHAIVECLLYPWAGWSDSDFPAT